MKKVLALFLTAFMLTLSGCSDITEINTDLMRPPRPTGERAVIQDVLTELAGGDFALKYPQNGEYISAIIMEDLTHSGESDAIALYVPNNEESGIHVAFISEVNDKWQSIGDFTVKADEIDRVLFADIDGDKSDEILVGWTNNNSTIHTLTVYDCDNDSVREMVIDDTYNEICVGDLTGNGCHEIVLLSLAVKDTPASAKILQYSENEKRPTAKFSVELSSNTVKYVKVKLGQLDNNSNCIFIDGETNGGTWATEMVYWDSESGTFINPMYFKNLETTNQTLRNMTISTQDIDLDGYTEVPVITEMPANIDEDPATVCSLVSWKSFSTEEQILTTKVNTVINREQNYCFAIPDRWNGIVTARIENENMVFYIWNTEKSLISDKLLTISPNELSEKDDTVIEVKVKNWKQLYAYIEKTALLSKNNTSLQISKNEVLNGFFVITN
ncbi:MAG: hypothetical protein ACI4M3_01885 [Acutalibacteraceae bacterium]